MAAAYRTIELTLISAKDLKKVNVITNMEVYAVVSISGDPRSRQRTPSDRSGGRNPSWNSTLRFAVPAADHNLALHVLLRSERIFGDRDVGEVRIPLKELLDAPESPAPKFLSYQVRRPVSGKPKGVLNLSYKLSPPIVPDPAAPPPVFAPKGSADEPVTAYPVAAGYPPQYAAAPPPYGYGAAPPPYPAAPYGYGGAPAGYGYPPPPPYGYGAAPPAMVQQPARKNGGGFGMGLLGGALGGLLIGDMISDSSAYDSGYDAGFDDGGGFGF